MRTIVVLIAVSLLAAAPVFAADDMPPAGADPAAMMGGPMMGWMMGPGAPIPYQPMARPVYGMGMPGMTMPMGYPGAAAAPYGGYGYGPGYMMGLGMMRFGMGPGMIRGLGMSGYIGHEAVQKFLDETKELRKQLHDLMFDYAEILRQPKIDREKRIEIENKIQALRQQVYEKAPRYQFWPY